MHITTALLALANILVPCAIVIFATGFFPYKPSLSGFAEYEKLQGQEPPPAPFDKVILMVVDALRSDFVFSTASGFKFTQQLISSGAAIPFTAHATSPTVTQPRVKAITTGSIPSYRDAILNFFESDKSSTLASQDTWLAQLKRKEGGKLVMYGDDTWLKLFPDFFARADGTTSFFVSDFTEVDNNVTRHVPDELAMNDWNGMVMHYLGLDHIGHKSGPYSPNMVPKQVEMDGIVKQIYHAIETQPHLESTLLVVLGDHGMNDGGNHGGSAPGETSTALVFISPKMRQISEGIECPTAPAQEYDYYKKIEQSDIAPTLAGLLQFPIPKNNLGVFISSFLPFWPDARHRTQLLFHNALQILTLVKQAFPDADYEHPSYCQQPSNTGEELSCQWKAITDLMSMSKPDPEVALQTLTKFCTNAQDSLTSTASNYNLSRLFTGIGVAIVSVVFTLVTLFQKSLNPPSTKPVFALIVLLYGIMMFASSYVEEEQNFWYWGTSAWLVYLWCLKSTPNSPVATTSLASRQQYLIISLVLLRITRRWNQTGQKFAGAPDIAHSSYLTIPYVLPSIVAVAYMVMAFKLRRGILETFKSQLSVLKPFGAFLIGAFVTMAYFIKLDLAAQDAPEVIGSELLKIAQLGDQGISLVTRTRGLFASLFLAALGVVITRKNFIASGAGPNETVTDLLMLFLATQSGIQNIPLLLIFMVLSFCLRRLNLTPTQISISTLLLCHVSYFALGNSNQTSSIDLSNAYNGISEYNATAVGLLVFISNWAGPIYWASEGTNLLIRQYQNGSDNDKDGNASVINSTTVTKTTTEWQASQSSSRQQEEKEEGRQSSSSSSSSPFTHHVALISLFMSLGLLSVMAACLVLRDHLFIWTVFSPKYLFAAGWAVAFHWGVVMGWCGFLWWVSGV